MIIKTALQSNKDRLFSCYGYTESIVRISFHSYQV